VSGHELSDQDAIWVFGYGSLVSPASLGTTIRRTPVRGVNFVAAEVLGWARRWNYGIALQPGAVTGAQAEGLEAVVALGIVPAPDQWMNGILALVSAAELARLDARERNYDRVDVTDLVRVFDGGEAIPTIHRAALYVPRPHAVAVYEQARSVGRAAIERRYWDLVDTAFHDLAPGHGERYRATTAAPDVPILDVTRV
jgi:cation transport regulator ChaC